MLRELHSRSASIPLSHHLIMVSIVVELAETMKAVALGCKWMMLLLTMIARVWVARNTALLAAEVRISCSFLIRIESLVYVSAESNGADDEDDEEHSAGPRLVVYFLFN